MVETLSDQRKIISTGVKLKEGKYVDYDKAIYPEEAVKSFIEQLKEDGCRCHLVCLTNVKCENCERINNLAGDKLI